MMFMTNEESGSVLNVRMFGGLSFMWKGQHLYLAKNISGKMVHLLLILLCAREQGVHRDELLDVLYDDSDTVQASNSLRTIVFRLRKALVAAGLPERDYIVVKNGRYCWNADNLEVHLDVDEFEQAVTEALVEQDADRRRVLLEQAEALYQGEFLPAMIGEEWIAILNQRYQKLYFTGMQALFELLEQQKEYQKILLYCDRILGWYPYEEWQLVKLDCLLAMEEYQAALRYHDEVIRFYQEEFGIAPSKALQQRRQNLQDKIDYKLRSIEEIREQIMEEENLGGATCCDYAVLAEVYRYMAQVMDRTGISVYLMLLTITDKDRMPIEKADVLEDVRGALKETIGDAIRKSDLYARYGKNQFLVLLLGTSQEGCRIVERRIRTNFQKRNTRKKVEICSAVGSILDIRPGMIHEYYNQNNLYWR